MNLDARSCGECLKYTQTSLVNITLTENKARKNGLGFRVEGYQAFIAPLSDAVEPAHIADSHVTVTAVVVIYVGAEAAVSAVLRHGRLVVVPVVLTVLMVHSEPLPHRTNPPACQRHLVPQQRIKTTI